MRKPDNTIVFGSQHAIAPAPAAVNTTPEEFSLGETSVQAVPEYFPETIATAAHDVPAAPRPLRPLADDLVVDHSFMNRPERGLTFAAVSLSMIGIAALATYFVIVRPSEPAVSTTSTTNAVVDKANPDGNPVTEVSTPTITRPAEPAAMPPAQPSWVEPTIDVVRDPSIKPAQLAQPVQANQPGAQVVPTERPQAATPQSLPNAAPPVKRANPTSGMSDEALERAGYYGNITPTGPTPVPPVANLNSTNGVPDEPKSKTPSAASTEEPKQFTPPSE